VSVREVPDACPGVLAPHDAADGALARIRLPGGVINATALLAVADIADDLGDGRVHLTSRGNLQLRGLTRSSDLVPRLSHAGLLPSLTHERVRNILASPLTGLAPLALALDRALCARPALAALPGRFLFALDSGRGDVAAEEPDLCWQAGRVLVGELSVPVDDPVAALLAGAEAFLAARCGEWRVRELPAAGQRAIADAVSSPVGAHERHCRPIPLDGSAVRADVVTVAPVLGELSADEVREITSCVDEAVVTPWRTILLAEPRDVPWSLPVDPAAALVSACAGRPGCAKALADVRADTRAAMAAGTLPPGRVHVSGCARRCGSPRGVHTAFVAGERYL
jgi:precorrin-3B synthase